MSNCFGPWFLFYAWVTVLESAHGKLLTSNNGFYGKKIQNLRSYTEQPIILAMGSSSKRPAQLLKQEDLKSYILLRNL